jgi:hypothetical protein
MSFVFWSSELRIHIFEVLPSLGIMREMPQRGPENCSGQRQWLQNVFKNRAFVLIKLE